MEKEKEKKEKKKEEEEREVIHTYKLVHEQNISGRIPRGTNVASRGWGKGEFFFLVHSFVFFQEF